MVKPLVYYCISTIIGCISALLILGDEFIGAALLAASFLVSIYFTISYKKFILIISLFMSISFINYIIYFNYVSFIDNSIKLRIQEKDGYNFIGEYKGKRLILKGNFQTMSEGEIVVIQGVFEKSPVFNKGIVGVYKVSAVKERTSDFIGNMYRLKRNINSGYNKVLGNKKAGIISAACFGDTTYIKSQQREEFNRLGILHVVSVSGLHLAIIYKLLEGLGGLKLALPLSLIYVLFTGGEPATLRAFIMIVILKISKKVFKNYEPFSALSLSALLLIFFRPYYITDIGFNLSFLSMLGIFLTYSKIRNTLIFLPKSLNEAISLSLSAQFLSAPYIIATLNSFSVGFLLGNIFLIPIFSLIVILGNISIVFINFPIVFNLFAKILNIILTAIEGGSKLLLLIAPEILQLPSTFSLYIVVIYCAYILFTSGKRKFVYLPLILIPILFFENYKLIPEIDYISVNYSNCVIFKYKLHNVLILDEKQRYVAEDRRFIKLNKVNGIFVVNNTSENIKIEDYYIKVVKPKEKSFMNVVVRNRIAGKVLLSENNDVSNSIYKNYDIINLKFRSSNKKYSKLCSIRILFGRYYLVT